MLKALALAVLASAVLASVARAGETNSASGLVVRVDWQTPEQLPPRFRNHCTLENFTSRPYCSDHCGIDYQFYYLLGSVLRLLPPRPRLLRLERRVALPPVT